MADQIKGTFKKVSSIPQASIGSLTVNGATPQKATDLTPLIDHIEALVGAAETTATHLGHLTTYGTEALQENNETIGKLVIHAESLAKEIIDASTTFQKTMQSLKLHTELPITGLSVGLPRAYLVALLASPPIYGAITWAILKFMS